MRFSIPTLVLSPLLHTGLRILTPFQAACLAAVSAGLALPTSNDVDVFPESGNALVERTGGPPTSIGFQFYRSTSSLLQWAVLGVSVPELRTGDLKFDISASSAVLVGEMRTMCMRFGSATVGNAASNAKWEAVYDKTTNTIGLIVDAAEAQVSALEWAQLVEYIETYYKSFGKGFGTQFVDYVPGVVLGQIGSSEKRDDLSEHDILRRQGYCTAETLTIADSIEDQIAVLPTVKLDC